MSDPVVAAPAPVLVENLLRRPKEGGTRIDIGGKEYHFKPTAEGREFCLVTDQAHLARMLSIPEAYVMIGVVQAPAAAETGAGAPAPVPAAFVTVPVPEPVPAPAPPVAAVVEPAAGEAAILEPRDPDAPPSTGEAGPATTIAPVVEGDTPPTVAVSTEPAAGGDAGGNDTGAGDAIPQDLAGLDLEGLREVFAKEVGRTANARAKPETLIAQIVAMREETGAAK